MSSAEAVSTVSTSIVVVFQSTPLQRVELAALDVEGQVRDRAHFMVSEQRREGLARA